VGYAGSYDPAHAQREADCIQAWRELNNGAQGAVGEAFDLFRQGYMYGRGFVGGTR
jgi:hypothetical protein